MPVLPKHHLQGKTPSCGTVFRSNRKLSGGYEKEHSFACLFPFIGYNGDASPAYISRILKRLRLHGIVKCISGARKYYLTKLGKAVITLDLKTKEMFIVPALAQA